MKPDRSAAWVWDAVVVGGGPAGCATAITLARAGLQVLILEQRGVVDLKLGESIPPQAIGMVEHFLGSLQTQSLSPPGSEKIKGNLSLWGDDQPQTDEFFFTPPGFGLRLDRPRFDETLRKRAVAEGVSLEQGRKVIRLDRPGYRQPHWLLASTNGSIRSRFIVDCSGRSSAVAGRLAVKRHRYDKLFAYALRFRPDHSRRRRPRDGYTHIESHRNGWWYGAQLPNSDYLVIFHTDRDLPAAASASSIDGFQRLLATSRHMANHLQQQGCHGTGHITGASAASERLDHCCSDGWLAAGDAAQSLDPLSSQGIAMALRSGIVAGQAIKRALAGKAQPFEAYIAYQDQNWHQYRNQYNYYYTLERRWPESEFWRRRHEAARASSLTG